MQKRVIVLGSAHYNTIGMVQALGREGVHVIGVLIHGGGIVKNSVYINEIYSVQDYQEGIDFIAMQLVQETPTVIIPCGDEAALLLESNREKLSEHFLFQGVTNCTMSEAMDKYCQTQIAHDSGFDVPMSFKMRKDDALPEEMPFPIIIKPLVSCQGMKSDIRVVNDMEGFERLRGEIFANTSEVIVSEFIQHGDNELNMIGCALKNGRCIVPCFIRKLRVHPKSRGSVSVAEIGPIEKSHERIVDSIAEFIRRIGYVGLFSVELMGDMSTGRMFFIEANLRNDALNPFVVKAGVNLPYLHVQDLMGEELRKDIPLGKTLKMICEPIHLASVYRHSINIFQWLHDVVTCDAFMLYWPEDRKLFWSQFFNRIIKLF